MFFMSAALLLLMFSFAFMQTPDVITCRSLPSASFNSNSLPLHPKSTSLQNELTSVSAASFLSSTTFSAANGDLSVSSLPPLWPPKVMRTMHCAQKNNSDWQCHELFSSAAPLFLQQLRNSSDQSASGRSTATTRTVAVTGKADQLIGDKPINWTAIEQTVESWYKFPKMFKGEWVEQVQISNDLLSLHMIQLRRSNYQYGFRLHCSHSYQSLDNLFDCRPARACEYKLFALLHLAVFQLGVAWFACGSLSYPFNLPPEVRFQQQRRDKHLLHTLKHAQALLLLVNAFCFLVHGLVPLATPLLYVGVYYLRMQVSLARTLSMIIIAVQYVLFTLCGVVLRSM
jgi:hypothetical protein